ncbi:MAG: hypothetical protein MR749_01165 [Succinatimonas hippei]|nr:hypothetical protein [Succinatimonas hippei]
MQKIINGIGGKYLVMIFSIKAVTIIMLCNPIKELLNINICYESISTPFS